MASRKSAEKKNDSERDLRELTRKIKQAVDQQDSGDLVVTPAEVKPARKAAKKTAAKTTAQAGEKPKKAAAKKTAAKASTTGARPTRRKKTESEPPTAAESLPSASSAPRAEAQYAQPAGQQIEQSMHAKGEASMAERVSTESSATAAAGIPGPDPTHVSLSAWPSSPIGGGGVAAPPAPPAYDPFADTRPLPTQYGVTRLTLLVRDPEWVYAFWEVNEHDRNRFGINGGNHGRRMALRIYDITGVSGVESTSRFYDIPITEYATSWYLHVGQPNRSWCVDLGMYDDQGNFITIARSNHVSTPRDQISDVVDEQWMSVDEESFRKLMRMSVGPGMLGGSEMLGIQAGQRLIPQFMPGASEMLQMGASERLGASEGRHVAKKAAPFHLQVRFELIVYGSTEPDATVTLCGQNIKLRPDGSFTVRYELPDGDRTIDVKAVKVTGDQWREVTSHIGKETH